MRNLATGVRPDILAYGLFLVGAVSYLHSGAAKHRLGAYFLWSLLIPIKLVAVVFVPAAVLADWISSTTRSREKLQEWSAGLAMCGFATAGVVAYNYATIGRWVNPSHEHLSTQSVRELLWFGYDYLRQFFWHWNGSVLEFPASAFFLVACALTIGCLSTLRWRHANKVAFRLGLSILVCTLALTLVRSFEIGPRLFSYGMLLVLASFAPSGRFQWLWVSYACWVLATGALNQWTSLEEGASHPAYEQLALTSRGLPGLGDAYTCTNSFHVLDLHIRIPTHPVKGYPLPEECESFYWVALPAFDRSGIVTEMDRPGADWCEVGAVPGATMFRRC